MAERKRKRPEKQDGSKTAKLDSVPQDLDVHLKMYDKLKVPEEKVRKAVNIFFWENRPPFQEYSGVYTGILLDALVRVNETLSASSKDIKLFLDGKMSANDIERFSRPFDNEMFRLFLKEIYSHCGVSPTIQDATDLITQWQNEIYGFLKRSQPLYSPEDNEFLDEQIRLAEKCHDDAYMSKFTNMLRAIKESRADPHNVPFVLICAPSGSGKSVFGTNLGAHAPSLHWLHKTSNVKKTDYRPYKAISRLVNGAVLHDFTKNKKIFKRKDSTTLSNVSEKLLQFPFKTVHIIVNLFKQLDEIKTLNPELSWLQAQALLKTVPEGEMTITAGRQEISSLAKKWEFPLSVFIDEYSMATEGQGDKHSAHIERHRLKLTRTLTRALGIIPILSGTDTRASNFFSRRDDDSRDSKELWCLIVNDLPAFSSAHLGARCAKLKKRIVPEDASHPVSNFLDFLNDIRPYENPWVIELALQRLETKSDRALNRWDGSLDKMLSSLYRQYTRRKKHPTAFSMGQVGYIMSHGINLDGNIVVNAQNGCCINSHMARLIALPDKYGQPFSSIVNYSGLQHYFTHEEDEFRPSSYFTHFSLAPLTGLMLFGLDLSAKKYKHAPFLSEDDFERLTCFDAVRKLFPNPNVLTPSGATGRKNDGSHLEILYHNAALVASRANGLKGCNFLDFLVNFIRELETDDISLTSIAAPNAASSDKDANSTNWTKRTLNIKGYHDFDTRRVPILSPMPSTFWPKSIVELLQAAPGGRSVLLGSYRHSLGAEPVDSVIFECGPATAPTPVPPCFDISGEIEVFSYNCKMFGADAFSSGDEDDDSSQSADIAELGHFDNEKLYGYMGSEFKVTAPSLRRISIVAECKQYHRNLTIGDLNVILDKFDKVKHCRTFMVLCLSTSNFNHESVYNATFRADDKTPIVPQMNQRGYYIWFVDKGEDDSYELKPIPGQVSNRPMRNRRPLKDVIVIGCEIIWGRKALKSIRNEWAASIKQHTSFFTEETKSNFEKFLKMFKAPPE